MPRGPRPPSGMLSGHRVLSQTSCCSTQHWKLRAATAWVCGMEGWRSGRAILRQKARGTVEDKTAREQVLSPQTHDFLSSSCEILQESPVVSLGRSFYNEGKVTPEAFQAWERRKYDTNVYDSTVPCAAGDTNWLALLSWAGFDCVWLPLAPQLPLSSLLCVPEG